MREWPLRLGLLAFVMVLVPPVGHAGDGAVCAGLKQVVELARSDFTISANGASTVAVPDNLNGASMCSMAKGMTGANSFHCAWQFPYRDDAALAAFGRFNELLDSCFGKQLQANVDSGVNHPDFFDLREYQIDQVKVSVSLKDKGQLGQTLVFVGVHGAGPN